MKAKILIVDDDPDLTNLIEYSGSRELYGLCGGERGRGIGRSA